MNQENAKKKSAVYLSDELLFAVGSIARRIAEALHPIPERDDYLFSIVWKKSADGKREYLTHEDYKK